MDLVNNNNEIIMKDIASRREFLYTLEWLLELLKRYSNSLQFGLVHIELGRDHELGEAFGVQEAFRQLALLTVSLTHDFRKTDLITRDVKDFWVIVPYNSDSEKINDKIIAIFQAPEHKDLNLINREISIFSLPLASTEDQAKITSAVEFLEYLKANKERLASHIFRLSANLAITNP